MTLAALLAGIVSLSVLWCLVQSIPETDVFGVDAEATMRALDVVPAQDARAIKLQHAVGSEPYDVGLFGNSRVLQVSAKHLGIMGEAHFFNFAVPGSSVRNSRSMLERLHEDGRLPRTVLIGLDNLHLEYFENAEADIFTERIILAVHDLGWILEERPPLVDGVRLIWRHAYMAWNSFESWLTFAVARQRYRTFADDCPPQYRIDGSRCGKTDPASEKVVDLLLGPRTPSVLVSVFREDMRRLKRLQDATGSRIIVFETPLHPEAVTSGGRAKWLRKVFLEECTALKIECYPALAIELAAEPSEWPDATHAPAQHLGWWLGQVIRTSSRTP